MARKPWDELIKQQLKQEVGLGWTICCHKRSEGYSSGRVKLTRRDPEDGSRTSVMLPFEWDSKNGTKILNRVVAISEQMESNPQMTLKDAAAITLTSSKLKQLRPPARREPPQPGKRLPRSSWRRKLGSNQAAARSGGDGLNEHWLASNRSPSQEKARPFWRDTRRYGSSA